MALTAITHQRGGKTTLALKATVCSPEDKLVGGIFFGHSESAGVAKKFSRSVTSPVITDERKFVVNLDEVEPIGGFEDSKADLTLQLCAAINKDRRAWAEENEVGGIFKTKIYLCETESGFQTWVPDVGYKTMEIPYQSAVESYTRASASTRRVNRQQVSMLARGSDFDAISQCAVIDHITKVQVVSLDHAAEISDVSMPVIVFIDGCACCVSFRIDEDSSLLVDTLIYPTEILCSKTIGFNYPSLVALEGLMTPLDAFENPKQGYGVATQDSLVTESPVSMHMRKGISAITDLLSVLRLERTLMDDGKHLTEYASLSDVLNKLSAVIEISQTTGPMISEVDRTLEQARSAIATLLFGAATRSSPFGVFDYESEKEIAEVWLSYKLPADKTQTAVLSRIVQTVRKVIPVVTPFLYDVEMFRKGMFDIVFDPRNTTIDSSKIVDSGFGKTHHVTAIELQFGLRGTYYCDSLSMWLYSLRDEKGGSGARGLSKKIPNALAKTTFSNAILLYAVTAENGDNDPFQATPLDHLINSRVEMAHENGFVTLPVCGYSRWTDRRLLHPIAVEGEDGSVYTINLPQSIDDASEYIDASGNVKTDVQVEALKIKDDRVSIVNVTLKTYMVNAAADQYAYIVEI